MQHGSANEAAGSAIIKGSYEKFIRAFYCFC